MSAQEQLLRVKAQLLRERMRLERDRVFQTQGDARCERSVLTRHRLAVEPKFPPASDDSSFSSPSSRSDQHDSLSSRSSSRRRYNRAGLSQEDALDELESAWNDEDESSKASSISSYVSDKKRRRKHRRSQTPDARQRSHRTRHRPRHPHESLRSPIQENPMIARVRSQMRTQQAAMLEVLGGLDNQLQAQLDLKDRQEFEHRLEQRITTQNKLMLAAIEQRLAPVLASHMHLPTQERMTAATSPTSNLSEQDQQHRSGHFASIVHQSSKMSNRMSAKMDHGLSRTLEEMRADVTSPNQTLKNNKTQQHATEKENEEPANIWEELLQDDTDLLHMSDDEGDKEETEKQEKDKATAAAEEKKRKALKAAVFGSGRPMYRWRKEGIDTPPADQVLKGKTLFRSIVCFFIALARMKRHAIARRMALAEDDRKEMEKGILWFADTTRSWMAQVLALPLADIVGKRDLNLDPSNTRGALGQKIGGGFWRAKPKRNAPAPITAETTMSDVALATLRLKVRVRGIFEALLNSLEHEKPPLPRPVVGFLSRLTLDGMVFPHNYLFAMEEEALDLGYAGCTRWMIKPSTSGSSEAALSSKNAYDEESENSIPAPTKVMQYDTSRSKLLLCTFLFVRCLVPVLCRPWELGATVKADKRSQANLLAVATMVYILTRSCVGGPEQGQPTEQYVRESVDGGLPSAKLGRRVSLRLIRRASNVSEIASVIAKETSKAKPRSRWFSRAKPSKSAVAPEEDDAKNVADLDAQESRPSTEVDHEHASGLKISSQGDDEEGKTEDNEAGDDPSQTVRYQGLEHYLPDLFQDKQLIELLQNEKFMAELKLVFQKCLLRLMQKAFQNADANQLPEAVLDQIEAEIAELVTQENNIGVRSVLRRRNDELLARQQRRIEKAVIEEKLASSVQAAAEAESVDSNTSEQVNDTKERQGSVNDDREDSERGSASEYEDDEENDDEEDEEDDEEDDDYEDEHDNEDHDQEDDDDELEDGGEDDDEDEDKEEREVSRMNRESFDAYYDGTMSDDSYEETRKSLKDY